MKRLAMVNILAIVSKLKKIIIYIYLRTLSKKLHTYVPGGIADLHETEECFSKEHLKSPFQHLHHNCSHKLVVLIKKDVVLFASRKHTG